VAMRIVRRHLQSATASRFETNIAVGGRHPLSHAMVVETLAR